MLLLMIERGMPIDIVLTADTGMEFPEMYDHLAKLDEYLYRERGIHLTMLRHPKGFEYMMFEEEKQKISSIENRQKLGVPLYGNGWPGVKVRWCTGQLKTHLTSTTPAQRATTTTYAALRTSCAERTIYPSLRRGARVSTTLSGKRSRAASPPCAA